ncbi:TlpA disulfide reductase family protein [uncultured Tenacibaculum sp.]|uniref:TlpA family protein disulfide reductase n=1 Tax=uncultured Tenacibaculum sp. TaxID=174713 RepID=UPI00261011FD|nr:TlpA disulfide reductase family protein [uncultured Tenacibaculum sp.]
MNIDLKKVIFFVVIIFLSCKNKTMKYEANLQEKVSRLKKLFLNNNENKKTVKWDSGSIPEIYIYDGKKLDVKEYQFYLGQSKYYPVFYLNEKNKVKIVVLEPLNEISQKLTDEFNEKVFVKNKQSPLFEMKDLEGELYNIDSLKGKVVVLNFWFIACPPCREEIPKLNLLVSDFMDKEVIFISITDDSKKRLNLFLNKHPFNYKHVSDTEIASNLKISSYPANIILDKNSKVMYFENGGRDDIYDKMKPVIQEALNN